MTQHELSPANTALSQILRSEQPGSVRAMALMMGSPWEWNAWRELDYSIRQDIVEAVPV